MSQVKNATRFGIEADWFDWSEAVPVEDREIKRWIKRCVAVVKEKIALGEFPAIGSISSGNRHVLVTCWRPDGAIHVEVLQPVLSYTIEKCP